MKQTVRVNVVRAAKTALVGIVLVVYAIFALGSYVGVRVFVCGPSSECVCNGVAVPPSRVHITGPSGECYDEKSTMRKATRAVPGTCLFIPPAPLGGKANVPLEFLWRPGHHAHTSDKRIIAHVGHTGPSVSLSNVAGVWLVKTEVAVEYSGSARESALDTADLQAFLGASARKVEHHIGGHGIVVVDEMRTEGENIAETDATEEFALALRRFLEKAGASRRVYAVSPSTRAKFALAAKQPRAGVTVLPVAE